jgi:hypothetical protein
MNRNFTSSLVTLTLLACVPGCGGSSTQGTTTPDAGSGTSDDASTPATDSSTGDAASASQACADWARARCQLFDSCSNGLYVPIHWGDEATCEANSVALCMTDLAAQGTAASAASFEACANALPTESCANFLGENPIAACAPLAGSVATGAACLTSSQCQSTFCALAATSTCGVCASVPQAGASCGVDADCGGRNSLTCAEGTCVALGAASASCSKTAPCGIGLNCVGEKKTAPGTCQPAASTVGATCDPNEATGAGCDATLELSCDPTTNMCVQNTVVPASATCGQVSGGIAKCSASGTCVVPTSDAGAEDAGAADAGTADAGTAPITGTCLAAAANGSACDTSSGPSCVPPAKCVTVSDASTAGTCQAPSAANCQ